MRSLRDTHVIRAERRVEDSSENRGYSRHELRSGSLTRTLPLPERPTRTKPTKVPVTTG